MSNRPSLGFDDDDDGVSPAPAKADLLDLSEFQPKAVTRPDRQKVAEAAAKAQFRSREAKPPAAALIAPVAKATRRRRTGRSAQLNLKCRPETIEQFYAIADANDWGLGEAFEQAVAMLKDTCLKKK